MDAEGASTNEALVAQYENESLLNNVLRADLERKAASGKYDTRDYYKALAALGLSLNTDSPPPRRARRSDSGMETPDAYVPDATAPSTAPSNAFIPTVIEEPTINIPSAQYSRELASAPNLEMPGEANQPFNSALMLPVEMPVLVGGDLTSGDLSIESERPLASARANEPKVRDTPLDKDTRSVTYNAPGAAQELEPSLTAADGQQLARAIDQWRSKKKGEADKKTAKTPGAAGTSKSGERPRILDSFGKEKLSSDKATKSGTAFLPNPFERFGETFRSLRDSLNDEFSTLQNSMRVRQISGEKDYQWTEVALIGIALMMSLITGIFALRRYSTVKRVPPTLLPLVAEKGTTRIIELLDGIPYYVVRDRGTREIVDSFQVASGSIDEARNHQMEITGALDITDHLASLRYDGKGIFTPTEEAVCILVHQHKKMPTPPTTITEPKVLQSEPEHLNANPVTFREYLQTQSWMRYWAGFMGLSVAGGAVLFGMLSGPTQAVVEEIQQSDLQVPLYDASELRLPGSGGVSLQERYERWERNQGRSPASKKIAEVEKTAPTEKPILDPKHYTDLFLEEKARHTEVVQLAKPEQRKLRVEFIKDNSSVEGSCSQDDDGTLAIHLNPAYWRETSNARREAVIFHELGHCILGLSHSDSGIMAPSGLAGWDYAANRENYLKQFFLNGRIARH
jgi:hypothetical protein